MTLSGINSNHLKRLKQMFQNVNANFVYKNSTPARTGQMDPTTGLINPNPSNGLADGYIWVRQSFDNGVTFSRAAVAALSMINNTIANMPCTVGYNQGGYLVAYDGYVDIETVLQYGKYAAAMATPVKPAELDNTPKSTALLLDGLVTVSPSGGLNLAIQAFNVAGAIFPLIDPLDISSHYPGSSGLSRWLGVSVSPIFDPSNPAASVHLLDGSDSSDPYYINTTAVAAALPFPAGDIPLAAVLLTYGDIEIPNVPGQILNLRQTFNPIALNKDRFVQTASVTVANTVTETTLLGAGQGNLTLPANFLTLGRTGKFEAWGVLSSLTLTPGTLTFNLKLGSVVLASTGAVALIPSLANALWHAEITVTTRTIGVTGTVMVQGKLTITNALADSVEVLSNGVSVVTIDTTVSEALDLTATFSIASASNTITLTNADLRVLDTNVA